MAGNAMIFQSGMLRTRCTVIRPTPTMFFYPGLTSKPFWNPSHFPWIKHHLEANLDVVRQEYEALKRSQTSDYAVHKDETTLHHGKWDWYSYIAKGKRSGDFATKCPETTAILESVPGLMSELPIAYAFYSRLHGNSSIAAHSGICNLRLRIHFPLTVPDNCGIRVGNETRSWKEGECLVLDDSYNHEVWNKSDTDRSMLLFDVWHPELSEEEIRAIIDMFNSVKK